MLDDIVVRPEDSAEETIVVDTSVSTQPDRPNGCSLLRDRAVADHPAVHRIAAAQFALVSKASKNRKRRIVDQSFAVFFFSSRLSSGIDFRSDTNCCSQEN
jgi:hypothetical protein